jgi:hypothetical protein
MLMRTTVPSHSLNHAQALSASFRLPLSVVPYRRVSRRAQTLLLRLQGCTLLYLAHMQPLANDEKFQVNILTGLYSVWQY